MILCFFDVLNIPNSSLFWKIKWIFYKLWIMSNYSAVIISNFGLDEPINTKTETYEI